MICPYEVPGQEEWEVDGEAYRGCPYKVISRQSVWFLKAYRFFKAGFFPNGKSWLEQPAKLLDAFDIIEKAVERLEEERAKKRKMFRA